MQSRQTLRRVFNPRGQRLRDGSKAGTGQKKQQGKRGQGGQQNGQGSGQCQQPQG